MPGDVLTVTRIDRLARSLADLALLVRELETKGIALKATEQPVDTSTPEECYHLIIGCALLNLDVHSSIKPQAQVGRVARATIET
jgi:DNA invertase Pin-like site-specific DNA recombinase